MRVKGGNLKQNWLPAFWKRIKPHDMLNRTLLNRAVQNKMANLWGNSSFFKPQTLLYIHKQSKDIRELAFDSSWKDSSQPAKKVKSLLFFQFVCLMLAVWKRGSPLKFCILFFSPRIKKLFMKSFVRFDPLPKHFDQSHNLYLYP